jgi:molybdopterin converting factor subunit 1
MTRILYFGSARDLAGVGEESVDMPDGATVASLWRTLDALHPGLAKIRPICRVAVDMHYATDESTIAEGSEIAIIPPVAGG